MARRRDGYVSELVRPKRETDLAIVVPPDGIRGLYREFHLRYALAPTESSALCGRHCDMDSLLGPIQWRTSAPGTETQWCMGCEHVLGGVVETAKRLEEQDKDMRMEPRPLPGQKFVRFDEEDEYP